MAYLLAASLLWAFSFGLIKGHLAAYDPVIVAFLRLLLSLVLFLPWLARRPIARERTLPAMGLGAVQFGLMYCLYIASYRYLPAYGVALFTILTPLYVVAIADVAGRRCIWRHFAAAGLAIAGAAVVLARGFPLAQAAPGIALLQAANLCFAIGQMAYRRLAAAAKSGADHADAAGGSRHPPADAALLGWMYLGAVILAGVASLLFGDFSRAAFDREAIGVLIYLGVVPTGIGFYLFNKGAARTGAGLLAVSNNLKVPLAVFCAWLVFGETADHARVLIGLAVIVAALLLAGRGGGGEAAESEAVVRNARR